LEESGKSEQNRKNWRGLEESEKFEGDWKNSKTLKGIGRIWKI
jgi:hypothetical protein